MRINDVNLLQQVVNYLNTHREAARVKKMLYCLCTNRWEKDTDYLNSINSQYLIEQIIREHGTLDQLKTLLQNLVKTVNKPKHYIEIAKVIYLSIGQLYPEFHQEHSRKSPAPTPVAPSPEPTQTYTSQGVPSSLQRAYAPEPTQLNTSQQDVPSSLQRAYAPEPTQLNTSQQEVPSSLQRAYAPEYTQQLEDPSPNYDHVDESAYETCYEEDIPADIPLDRPEVPDYDPFVLRQNVMSCTNPLRSKIILLVMLRPHFNFGSQSAVTMREYHLDDLLLEVMKTHSTIQDLEESITNAVEQLVEVEEYGKAATGLLQSLVPLYTLKTATRMPTAA